MFSKAEKQVIAAGIEGLLLGLRHPEMPTEKPRFKLEVFGKASYSWADIVPNWTFAEEGSPENPNPWNEKARDVLQGSWNKPNAIVKKRDGTIGTTCYNGLDGVGIKYGEHFFDIKEAFPEPDEIIKNPREELTLIKGGSWEKDNDNGKEEANE